MMNYVQTKNLPYSTEDICKTISSILQYIVQNKPNLIILSRTIAIRVHAVHPSTSQYANFKFPNGKESMVLLHAGLVPCIDQDFSTVPIQDPELMNNEKLF